MTDKDTRIAELTAKRKALVDRLALIKTKVERLVGKNKATVDAIKLIDEKIAELKKPAEKPAEKGAPTA